MFRSRTTRRSWVGCELKVSWKSNRRDGRGRIKEQTAENGIGPGHVSDLMFTLPLTA